VNGVWTAGAVVQAGLITASAESISVSAHVTLTIGPPERLSLAHISDQVAGRPFTLTLGAYDAYTNLVASFDGAASLSDSTVATSPTLTGNFDGGVWSGLVEIAVGANDVVITATAGATSGFSNPFDVTTTEPIWYYLYLPMVVNEH
jgi:hypothetical protein